MKSTQELANDSRKPENVIKENLEPDLIKTFNTASLAKARRTALILGGILVASLIAIVFAFVQDTLLNEQLRRKSDLQAQISLCVQEAQKQQALASENMMIIEEANKMAEEQLRACQSKK